MSDDRSNSRSPVEKPKKGRVKLSLKTMLDEEVGAVQDTDRSAHKSARQQRPKLSLGMEDKMVLNQSYEVTEHGTLKTGGFEINRDGVTHSPSISTHSHGGGHSAHSRPGSGRKAHSRGGSVASFDLGHIEVDSPAGPSRLSQSVAYRGNSRNHSLFDSAAAEHHRQSLSPRGSQYGDYEEDDDAVSLDLSSSLNAMFTEVQEDEVSGRTMISQKDLVEIGSLGQGAGGAVVRALHVPTAKLYAVKYIDWHQREKRHQLNKELRGLVSLSHPNCIRFENAFFENDCLTVVLEYMNRGNLQSVVDDFGALDEETLRDVAHQVVEGLYYMHSNKQIHRDIKPANILLNHKGEVKIADYGLLGNMENKSLCETFVGTAVYMSPERIKAETYGAPGDIWSLGLTLITCATGKFPLDNGQNGYWGLIRAISENEPPSLSRAFSPELRSFVDVCLKKDPEKRWTAEKLREHPFLRNHSNIRRRPSRPTSGGGSGGHASHLSVSMCESKFSGATSSVADAPYQRSSTSWNFEDDFLMHCRKSTYKILREFAVKYYFKADKTYRRSFSDQATLQRLASQLGLPTELVVGLFEDAYDAIIDGK